MASAKKQNSQELKDEYVKIVTSMSEVCTKFVLQSGQTLRKVLEPLMVLTRWQQAPIAALMLEFEPLVKEFVKALCD